MERAFGNTNRRLAMAPAQCGEESIMICEASAQKKQPKSALSSANPNSVQLMASWSRRYS